MSDKYRWLKKIGGALARTGSKSTLPEPSGGKSALRIFCLGLTSFFLISLLLFSVRDAVAGGPAANDKVLALKGARILTSAGQNYDSGTIVIKSGKILEISENPGFHQGPRLLILPAVLLPLVLLMPIPISVLGRVAGLLKIMR